MCVELIHLRIIYYELMVSWWQNFTIDKMLIFRFFIFEVLRCIYCMYIVKIIFEEFMIQNMMMAIELFSNFKEGPRVCN